MWWIIISVFVSTNFLLCQLQGTTIIGIRTCFENETETDCEVICPPENCDISYTTYNCDGINTTCRSGCKCKENYLRNASGTCILNDDCPPPPTCSDPNAIPNQCASACQPTCQTPEPVCTDECVINGCECVEGYILEYTNGQCIPKTECPSCEDPNASINECASACQPTCKQPNPSVCTEQCVVNGCECKSGYILDDSCGYCIPISKCPKNIGCNGDENAHISECVSCSQACEDNEALFCPAWCRTGCDCNKNYTYSKKYKKCIPTSSPDCVQCPKNEIWSYCKAATCAPLDCKEVGYPAPCPDYNAECNDSGCICKYSYVRNSKGVCIPQNECPSCGGDKNATGGCVKSCKNYNDNYCYNYKKNVTCDQTCDYYGCECKDGYVYDDVTERCVLPDDCPVPCKGDPHAFIKPGCSSSCPPTCAVPNPTVCNKLCILNACTCYEGWILDKKGGKCVKVDKCPLCPDPNASPNECGSACQPTCAIPDPACTRQCVIDACECNYGYILDRDNGTCIRISDCPKCSCNGDPNAHITDCKSCTPACEDTEPISCVAACYTGCECNKNYTYSRKAGKCIPSSSPECCSGGY